MQQAREFVRGTAIMRRPLLAATALLTLAASTVSAGAVPTTFAYTGALQTFTASSTGTYDIVAIGAGGGDSTSGAGLPGGLGARVEGSFDLIAGEVLSILVGGHGITGGTGGGGGGSFVVEVGGIPLLVAGGGGGSSLFGGGDGTGVEGTGGGGAGGSGNPFSSGGGGGGGLLGNGATGGAGTSPRTGLITNPGGGGGLAFVNGGAGGAAASASPGAGGFGGGGGRGDGGGGGGGGYTGGTGGFSGLAQGGLGGSSFDAGDLPVVTLAANVGDGSVVISALSLPPTSVPEPASLALLGASLVGAGLVRRRQVDAK